MEGSYSSALPIEADVMAQFFEAGAHSHHCFAYEQQDESMDAMAAMFLPGLDTESNSSSSCLNHDMSAQCWPQPQPGNSSSVTSFLDPAHGYESFEFPVMDPFPHADFAIPFLGEDLSHLHGNHSLVGEEETTNDHTPVTNKRKSRATTTVSKKAKKAGKRDSAGNNEDAYVVDPQSSSSCTSEDGDLDGNTKSSLKKAGTRASRGEATDPQSLYARKRRERINERLKTLQNLVPNGTKVDISTMLEEAVQYVKFMQLQIKLLSSDDMWMYAPLAYNGMNVSSLDLHISALQK
ncbi:uncharacterized protein [Lolium perenne]|uniref:uncharacterized protein n=1 Tax=Lolium perenne TaxID=4522 RepID=UPI0021EA7EAD|nr:transcription factor bHLH84-like isoform X1 [Lolium perenne]